MLIMSMAFYGTMRNGKISKRLDISLEEAYKRHP